MKIIRTLIIVLLFVFSLLPFTGYAQDDMDLESLLSDLSEDSETSATPSASATDEKKPQGAESVSAEVVSPAESNSTTENFSIEELSSDNAASSEIMATETVTPAAANLETMATDGSAASVTADNGALDEEDVLDTELLLLEDGSSDGPDTDLSTTDVSPAASEQTMTVDEQSVEDLLSGADQDMKELTVEQERADVPPSTTTASQSTAGITPVDVNDVAVDSVTEETAVAETGDEVTVVSAVAEPEGASLIVATEGADEAIQKKSSPKKKPAVKAYSHEEEVRRQALEIEGRKNLQDAFSAYDRGQYEEAVKNFDLALEKLPERPANSEDIKRAKWGHAEADYRLALACYKAKEPDLKKAEEYVTAALSFMPDNRAAQSLQNKIVKAKEREAYLKTLPVPARKNPEVIAREKSVDDLIREGRDYYSIGDYDRAEALFSSALAEDQYNTTAMRYLRKIGEKKESISDVNFLATKANAMAAVRETWTPPIMEDVVLPEKIEKGAAIEKLTDAERLRERMSNIIIPKIEFRDANIQDVVDFLAEASQAADPNQQGVNIVLHMKGAGAEAKNATSSAKPADRSDEFGFDAFDGMFDETTSQQSSGSAAPSSGISLTLNLRRISLLDAIKTITEIAGMRYRIDGNIVIISPQGYVTGQVVTRMYPVQPTILDVIVQRDTSAQDKEGDFIEMGSKTTFERSDVKDFFEKAGVPFPQGTSITYNPGISQLIVANTPENLEIFERILAQLNVIPNQVEIEARFIEISEDNLRELGLEWILNDNWEIATKSTSGSVSGSERIQVNENSNGFTEGLRFFGYSGETGTISPQSAVTASGSSLGSILSISSILTNPELSVVLHALDQSGGTDLLSAPRVTTRSGYNATIQVVREIIYPTEFDAQSQSVGTGAGESSDKTVVVVTPGSFETREVGVILNVTPTVGPDGYTIDLAMVPEVSELIGWIEYGSSMGDLVYHMPQPIFSSRNVTTSIVIWDGQTVVMGGMIREELTTVNDKIPLLGDIPLLGRLFRSEGEYSQKKNLLIFVTARLVDPAGKPIHKRENVGGMPVASGGEENAQQM